MDSPLALVASITKLSARSLRDGESPVSPDPDILDGVDYSYVAPPRSAPLSAEDAMRLLAIYAGDMDAIRGGPLVHFDELEVDRPRARVSRKAETRRPVAKPSGNAGLLSGAFERTPEVTPVRGEGERRAAKRARSPAAKRERSPVVKRGPVSPERRGSKKTASSRKSSREESPDRRADRDRDARKSKAATSRTAAKPPSSARATPEQTKKRTTPNPLRSSRNPLRSIPQTPDEMEVRESRSSTPKTLTPKKPSKGRAEREVSGRTEDVPRKRRSSTRDEDMVPAPAGETSERTERRRAAMGTPRKESRSEARRQTSPAGAGESEHRSVAPSGFRSAPPGEKAAAASASASASTQLAADPFVRRRGWTLSTFFDRFKEAKDAWEKLWEASPCDKDAFERSSRELVLLCFDLLLAREQDMRSKSSEMRRSKKKRDELKKTIRNNYLYLSHRLIPKILERLGEIERSRDTLFYRMTTRKVKLRLFALSRLYEDEEEKRVNDIKNMIDELAEANKGKGGKVELSLRHSELAQMRNFMTEYCNLLRICDGVVSDDCGPQEPGAECYVQ